MTFRIVNKLNDNTKDVASIGSPSDSFTVTLDILGVSSEHKILGDLVYFITKENQADIVSLGQINEIKTINKWHEEPSFKAVIKRHGNLPHLSGDADNRIASLTIQSSFKIIDDNTFQPYKLSNSPSTGVIVKSMTNELMQDLTSPITVNYKTKILGNAFDTDVEIPFWFKHFGDGHNGAGDAYHIGVFGKTGSGKTTTAARMLEGYAENSEDMSFLIFDPQEQFYNDNKVIPNGSFEASMRASGIDYKKVIIPTDISLPNDAELFAELLSTSGFLNNFFGVKTPDKKLLLSEAIQDYVLGRMNNPSFSLNTVNPNTLLSEMVNRFLGTQTNSEQTEGCSKYVSSVYSKGAPRTNLINRLTDLQEEIQAGNWAAISREVSYFLNVMGLFQASTKLSVDDMVKDILNNSGKMYVINLSPRANQNFRNDNVQAKIIDVIMTKVIESSEVLASNGSKANCLIVMDEAHRYVNSKSNDARLKELNNRIVDSVRTVRKYGVGHMFITQTIDSIDQDVIQQMRVFAFGFGLTMASEFSKVKQIINDDNSAQFYRSFIDPSSNGKFPFMFYGPISPLSFTGSPLFIEMKK